MMEPFTPSLFNLQRAQDLPQSQDGNKNLVHREAECVHAITKVEVGANAKAELQVQREKNLSEFAVILGSHCIGNISGISHVVSNRGSSGSQHQPGTAAAAAQELMQKAQSHSPRMGQYLYRDDADPTGGAICNLPSLDLHSSDDTNANGNRNGSDSSSSKSVADVASNLLPGVGVSHLSFSGNAAASATKEDAMPPPPSKATSSNFQIPAMAASVFDPSQTVNTAPAKNNLTQNGTNSNLLNGNGTLTTMSDSPNHITPSRASSNAAVTSANATATLLEHRAPPSLSSPTTWTRSSLPMAPSTLLRSLAASFSALVDSRVRAWTLLLLRNSLSSGDEESRGRLLNLLATSSTMDLTAIVTRFQTLEMPKEARDLLESQKKAVNTDTVTDNMGTNGRATDAVAKKKIFSTEDCDLVLPVIFEAVVDVTLQGQQVTLKLRAPGTIAANFNEDAALITHVEVKLDTNALVSSMVEQARLVVFKAVARATDMATSNSLSKFGSALKLSHAAQEQNQKRTSLTKASASALRFSSLLTSKSNLAASSSERCKLGEKKKQRSVTWNHQIEDSGSNSSHSDHKRRKLGNAQPLLKRSSKSFGKPESNDFKSFRNATFSEFGGYERNNVPSFGANGRLEIPTTYGGLSNFQGNGGRSTGFRMNGMGMASSRTMGNLAESSNVNASFSRASESRSMTGFNSNNRTGGFGGLFRQQTQTAVRKPNFSDLARNGVFSQSLHRQQNVEIDNIGATMKRTPTQLESLLLSANTDRSRSVNMLRNDRK